MTRKRVSQVVKRGTTAAIGWKVVMFLRDTNSQNEFFEGPFLSCQHKRTLMMFQDRRVRRSTNCVVSVIIIQCCCKQEQGAAMALF